MNWGKLFNSKRNKRVFYVLASIVVFVTTYMLVLPALTIDEDTALQDPGISNETLSEETVNELETVADPFTIEQDREEALNNTNTEETSTTDSSAVDSLNTQNTIQEETPLTTEEENTLSVSPDEDKISAVLEGDFYLFDYISEEIDVFVKAPVEAFPEGTTMKITPVESEEVIDTINNTLDSTKAKRVQAVDITFYNAEGEEIEPLTDIKVSMKSNLIKESKNTQIVHIDNEGTGSIVEQTNEETADNEVAFESKDFSTYVVVVDTEITITNDEGNNETYVVSVTYGPETGIPDGSYVRVDQFSEESEEYLAAYNAVVGDNENEVGFIAFDLSIYDQNNNKIEPEAPVKVSLELKTLPDVSIDVLKNSMELKHIVETNEGLIAEDVANTYSQYGEFSGNITVEDESVTALFNVDGFSTFTFTWTDDTLRENVIVHYVDINGTEIQGLQRNDVTVTGNITFSNYEGGISGYTFKEARLDSVSGSLVTGFNRDGNNNRLRFVNNGTNVRDVERPYNVEVFFIYEPNDYPEGGDVPDLDAPATEKTLVRQDDGTYDITLSISGTSQEGQENKKANIVVVYDSSNSMSDTDTTTTYEKDNNGMYGLVDGEYVSLTNSRIWYMDEEVYTGYRYLETTSNSGTQFAVYNNQLINIYYNNGTWYRNRSGWWQYQYSDPWYGTRYLRTYNGSEDTSYNLGFDQSDGQMKELSLVEALVYYEGYTPVIYSGDRYRAITITSSRDEIAKSAVTSLANKLFALNTATNPDMVEMAFLDFGTMVNEVNGESFSLNGTTLRTNANPTTDKQTFLNWLNGVVIPDTSQSINDNLGGTNWEEGLKVANLVSFNDSDPVYIIFISDGEPTYRVSQNGHNDNSNQRTSNGRTIYVYGSGSGDGNNFNLDAAVMEAKNILASNKVLYTVGAFVVNNNKLPNLGGQDFDAADSDKLTQALNDIVDSITKALNITNVHISDGLTSFTASAFVGGDVDPDSFRYTKGGQPWAPLNDGAERADVVTLEDGSQTVEWNMGEDYLLEKGVEYTVTFTVWPKQEAYDLLADLNNGLISYDSLEESVKKQIIKNGDTYTVLTNTNASASYQVVSFEDGKEVGRSDPKTTTIQNPTDGMGLSESHLDLRKEWNDSLDPTQLNSLLTSHLKIDESGDYYCDYKVVLHVTNDNNEYVPVTITPDVTVVDGKVISSTWPTEKVYIAPGVMLSKEHAEEKGIDPEKYTEVTYGDKTYIVLETGHDYSIDEQNTDYHFELRADTYHPMVIDGNVCNVEFIFDDSDTITGIKAIDTTNTGTIVAVNELRAGINLRKIVTHQNGDEIYPEEQYFYLKVSLKDKDNNSILFENYQDPDHDSPLHDSTYITDEGDEETVSVGWDTYPIWYNIYYDAYDDLDTEGTYIPEGEQYYQRSDGMVVQDGGIIRIKAGDVIRFANVPIGTQFSFIEGNIEEAENGKVFVPYSVPDGYTFVEYQHKEGKATDEWTTETDVQVGYKNTTIGNQSYYFTFENKQTGYQIELFKKDGTTSETKALKDAEFELYHLVPEHIEDGETIPASRNKIGSSYITGVDGIVNLGKNIEIGEYELIETNAPSGYNPLENAIKLYITADGVKYAQTDYEGGKIQNAEKRTDEDTHELVYKITITNNPGTVLPHTGGNGTSKFYILGSMLIAGSLMYEYSLRRNRKRKEVK